MGGLSRPLVTQPKVHRNGLGTAALAHLHEVSGLVLGSLESTKNGLKSSETKLKMPENQAKSSEISLKTW